MKRSLWLFWIVLGLMAGCVAFLRISATKSHGAYNYTSGCEESSIHNFQCIQYGEAAYDNCFSYPYRLSIFNWFFYESYGRIAALADPSALELPQVLRMVTLGFALAGAMGTFFLLRRESGAVHPALAACCAVVTWLGPTLGWWSMTVRPDVPAVACEFLGLAVVAGADRKLSCGRALFAGLLFFLGWSFKQSAVGMLAGTLLALAWRREWAGAVVLSLTFALPAGGVVLAGGFAYQTNVLAAPALAPFGLAHLVKTLGGWLFDWGFYLTGAGMLWLVLRDSEAQAVLSGSRSFMVLALAFGASLLLALATSSRAGSWKNYYFATWVAGMACFGMISLRTMAHIGNRTPDEASDRSRGRPPGEAAFTIMSLALVVLAALHTAKMVFAPPADARNISYVELYTTRLSGQPYSPELIESVRNCPRPLLCDDSRLLVLALGREACTVPVIDPTVYFDALNKGKIADEPIARRIAARQYATLWLFGTWSDWEQDAIQAGYVVAHEEGGLRMYLPPAP